jgi:hypothetical protein
LFLAGIGRFRADLADLGCTEQNLGGCGPASLWQQHFFVNDPNGRMVCSAGAAHAVNSF